MSFCSISCWNTVRARATPAPMESRRCSQLHCVCTVRAVANHYLAILQCHRVLKPGGRLIVIVPGGAYPYHWGPWDFNRYSTDTLKVLASPFDSIELCGSWRSADMARFMVDHYPNVKFYPAQDQKARELALSRPRQTSATLPDYGRGPSRDGSAERTSTGDAKYGDFIFAAWLVARRSSAP